MSVDLSIDSLGESFYSRDDFAALVSRWYGRNLSCGDIPAFLAGSVLRITELLSFGDIQSRVLAFPEKQIAILIRKANGWEVQQSGWGKKFSKGWKNTWNKTCDIASDAWKSTCEVAQKTCESVQEFWEDHKKEIIIGTCIVVTAAAVVAVAVYTAGTGTQAAVAGGAALINSLAADSPDDKLESSTQIPFPEPSPEGVSLAEDLSPISSHLELIEEFAIPSALPFQEISLPSEIAPPAPTLPEPPLYQTTYSQLSLETLYGEDYVSQLYEQFGLSDPYLSAPQVGSNLPASPLPSPNRQFIELIEANLKEARDFVRTESRPSPNQPFIELIDQKLKEVRAPDYLDQLLSKDSRPPSSLEFTHLIEMELNKTLDPDYVANLLAREPKHSSQEFRDLVRDVLNEADEAKYLASLQIIQARYPKVQVDTSILRDNYASSLSSQKPAAPFREVPLIGYLDQSTIHFHCGINNDFSSIVEGGLRLTETLDKAFAVQPHLLHASNIVRGLAFVGLEQLETAFNDISNVGLGVFSPLVLEAPGFLLENSQIQRSIDYEVESLSRIAKNIIARDNPKLKQVHVTFSNGGHVFREALKQLPPEYQETIVVITTGTTAIIENHLACEVYNAIGDKDWPSKICNKGLAGIEAAKVNAEVEVVKQGETEVGLGGHYFMQQDYQDLISEIINGTIIGKYEIY